MKLLNFDLKMMEIIELIESLLIRISHAHDMSVLIELLIELNL